MKKSYEVGTLPALPSYATKQACHLQKIVQAVWGKLEEREQKSKMWCQNGDIREVCRPTYTERAGKGKRQERQLRNQER